MKSNLVANNTFWHWWTLIILLIFIGSIFTYGRVNESGYCLGELRRLSDDELINAAVDYVIRRTAPSGGAIAIENGKAREIQDLRANNRKYTSAAEFRSANPSCCRILDDAEYPGYLIPRASRARGEFAAMVRVEFIHGKYESDFTVKQQLQSHHIAVTNCGTVLENS